MTKRWVIVGGGHAHLHGLRHWARRPLADVELVLISPFAGHHYSGMVPGLIAHTYRAEDLTIDLRALAGAAGARFVEAPAEAIDGRQQTVQAAGASIEFDVASCDVGSAPAGLETPGAGRHALSVRPMSRAIVLRDRLEHLLASRPASPLSLSVVGGGAAGMEVAFALAQRARSRQVPHRVVVIESGETILSDFSAAVRRLALAEAGRRGIVVRTGARVTRVEADALWMGRESLASDLTVWLPGAAPPALWQASTLPRDTQGFFLVDATLRSVDGSPVWGAGDCIGLVAAPDLPKAGVHAVRGAPVLDHNIRAALAGGAPRRFRPQSGFLALLSTADGRAILRWHRCAVHTRWAWRLKDRIDRRFVGQYRPV